MRGPLPALADPFRTPRKRPHEAVNTDRTQEADPRTPVGRGPDPWEVLRGPPEGHKRWRKEDDDQGRPHSPPLCDPCAGRPHSPGVQGISDPFSRKCAQGHRGDRKGQFFPYRPLFLQRTIAPQHVKARPRKTDLQPAYGVHSHSHPTSNHSLPEGPGQLPDARTPTANHSAKKEGVRTYTPRPLPSPSILLDKPSRQAP